MCSGACRQDVLCPADVVVKAISEAQIGQNESQVAMELNEVCDLIIDCEHKTAPTQETGFPSIRTPNIGRGRFILDGVNRVSEETYSLWTKRAVPQPGDLIMAREAPVGNVAMIPEGLRPCLGQRTLLIRPDRTKVEPSFLNYFLNGPHVQGLIHAKTNGATVAHLNMKDVRTMTLPELPPLPMQRRIAGILSAYDELIENSQRRIKILESMARALYREWFVHFRFPGHEKHPRVASTLGDIPQGWEVKPLFELTKVNYGKNLPTKELADDGAYPVYGAAKIIGHYTAYNRKNRSIICGCRGSVGEMQITQPHCFVTNNSFTFDPAHSDNFFWLFQTLNERGLRDVVGGAAQPQITLEGISSVKLVAPPLSLRSRFQQVVSALFEQAWTLSNQIQNLRRTRDLLLPRLLSGQLEIGNN